MTRTQTTDRPIISVDFSDGHEVFRTYYHSDFTETQRAAILHICANAGRDPAPPAEKHKPILFSGEEATLGKVAADRTMREQEAKKARLSGYTGDMCGQCGSTKMRRNGSCLLCEGCGATTGCS